MMFVAILNTSKVPLQFTDSMIHVLTNSRFYLGFLNLYFFFFVRLGKAQHTLTLRSVVMPRRITDQKYEYPKYH